MGLFLRSNGYYYAELVYNGRKMQRSLKTNPLQDVPEDKAFARDLYHVLLREKIVKDFFPTQPTDKAYYSPDEDIYQALHAPPSVSLDKCSKAYLQDCLSRGLGKRSLNDKARFFKILTRYKFTRFEALTPDNVNRFWDELKKAYAPDTLRKIFATEGSALV
ncbi:MAG: hypothetical protein ACRCY4_10765 [Brevinema sp.]